MDGSLYNDSGHSGTSGLHVEEVVLDTGSTILLYIIAHCMKELTCTGRPIKLASTGTNTCIDTFHNHTFSSTTIQSTRLNS